MWLVFLRGGLLLACMQCVVVTGQGEEGQGGEGETTCHPWNCPCAGVRPRRLQKRFYQEAGRDIHQAQNQTEHILGRMMRERFREQSHLDALQSCADSRSPHCAAAHVDGSCNLTGLPVVVRLGRHQFRTDSQGALEFVQVARALLAKMAVFVQQARFDEQVQQLGPARSLANDIIQLEQDSLYYILCNLNIALNDTNIRWGPEISREIMESGCRILSQQAPTDNKNYLVFYTLKRLLGNIADYHSHIERQRRQQKRRQHSKKHMKRDYHKKRSEENVDWEDIDQNREDREVEDSRESGRREDSDVTDLAENADDVYDDDFSPRKFLDIKLHEEVNDPYVVQAGGYKKLAPPSENKLPEEMFEGGADFLGALYDSDLWRSQRRMAARGKRSADRKAERRAARRRMRKQQLLKGTRALKRNSYWEVVGDGKVKHVSEGYMKSLAARSNTHKHKRHDNRPRQLMNNKNARVEGMQKKRELHVVIAPQTEVKGFPGYTTKSSHGYRQEGISNANATVPKRRFLTRDHQVAHKGSQ